MSRRELDWDDVDLALRSGDFRSANEGMAAREPEGVVRWVAGLGRAAFATTSFSANAAVLLHLLAREMPGLPVVWIDTGYNTPETIAVADELTRSLGLALRRYAPRWPAKGWETQPAPPPTALDGERYRWFVDVVKHEPFVRAVRDLRPEIWITGIRAEETEHRRRLGVLSRARLGLLRVAPLFHWSEAKLADYCERYSLPSPASYFDPTKSDERAECGLHHTD